MTIATKFTQEFKEQAVKLVQQEKRGVTQAARELGVSPSALRAWTRRYGERAASAALVPGETPEQELLRLRKELRIAQMEREILKKAAAFFANESR